VSVTGAAGGAVVAVAAGALVAPGGGGWVGAVVGAGVGVAAGAQDAKIPVADATPASFRNSRRFRVLLFFDIFSSLFVRKNLMNITGLEVGSVYLG
jgi:hypothetical protein